MKFSYYRVKLFLGTRVLDRLLKKVSKRKMRSCNIDDAKSLGMICVIKNREDYESVVEIIDSIKSDFSIPKITLAVDPRSCHYSIFHIGLRKTLLQYISFAT